MGSEMCIRDRWKDCTGAFRRAFRNSAMVFIIIAASGPFSWLLTSLGAIGDLETWLLGLADSPILFILALILFIFLLGTVMDSAVNIIIVGPVLVNVMSQAGFPEVQAAMVVIVGFLIGSVTPPVGVAYFTSATIAPVSYTHLRAHETVLDLVCRLLLEKKNSR